MHRGEGKGVLAGADRSFNEKEPAHVRILSADFFRIKYITRKIELLGGIRRLYEHKEVSFPGPSLNGGGAIAHRSIRSIVR